MVRYDWWRNSSGNAGLVPGFSGGTHPIVRLASTTDDMIQYLQRHSRHDGSSRTRVLSLLVFLSCLFFFEYSVWSYLMSFESLIGLWLSCFAPLRLSCSTTRGPPSPWAIIFPCMRCNWPSDWEEVHRPIAQIGLFNPPTSRPRDLMSYPGHGHNSRKAVPLW